MLKMCTLIQISKVLSPKLLNGLKLRSTYLFHSPAYMFYTTSLRSLWPQGFYISMRVFALRGKTNTKGCRIAISSNLMMNSWKSSKNDLNKEIKIINLNLPIILNNCLRHMLVSKWWERINWTFMRMATHGRTSACFRKWTSGLKLK